MPTTTSVCEHEYEPIDEREDLFGPVEESSSPRTDDTFRDDSSDEIAVTLKFNAYQVLKADIEDVYFETSLELIKAEAMVAETNATFPITVSQVV